LTTESRITAIFRINIREHAMVALSEGTKVIIIGSGLSGAALAQILRKENVDLQIFDRDDGTRSQGWTISLDEFVDDESPSPQEESGC
jgi:monoamine oxidase